MYYQIITYSDNYYIISDDDINFDGVVADAKWIREAPDLILSAIETELMTKEDIQGNRYDIQYDYAPVDQSEWEYRPRVVAELTQTQVMQDTAGDYQFTAYYVSDHTYLVEVLNTESKEILAKSIPALWEPKFGVDVADIDNILQTAEELCVLHESGDFQEFLKVE